MPGDGGRAEGGAESETHPAFGKAEGERGLDRDRAQAPPTIPLVATLLLGNVI